MAADEMQTSWTAVDDYLTGILHRADPALSRAIAESEKAALPAIQVSESEGKFLHLLARLHGSRRILEIGTLGGYSTIWLARALPADGRLTTIELEQSHARVAASNLASAGVSDRIDLRTGAALDVLPQIESEGLAPFDFIFIDADKENNAGYLDWALRLSRSGSVIVVDNVVRAGAVTSPSDDPKVSGSREALEWMGRHPRLDCTALQTVGSKGYDGFALALVKESG